MWLVFMQLLTPSLGLVQLPLNYCMVDLLTAWKD